eukprot:scaffold470262_cov14-Prasinocladus_malaysianus.AAC.1
MMLWWWNLTMNNARTIQISGSNYGTFGAPPDRCLLCDRIYVDRTFAQEENGTDRRETSRTGQPKERDVAALGYEE